MGIEPIYNSSAGYPIDLKRIDWNLFRNWIDAKLSKRYSNSVRCYAKKYYFLMNDVRQISLVPATNRNNVIKSLILLSKFLGVYDVFRSQLKKYGVVLVRQDSLQAFLRMFRANSNVGFKDWWIQANTVLKPHEQLFLRFARFTGIRRAEAVNSFNIIIRLSREKRLSEYYDKELNVLMHFKYPKIFIRRTKNVYISFVPQSMIDEISSSEPLTYNIVHRRLNENSLKSRINELRDQFGTYLLGNGILEQEVNLLQGRIPVSVFVRHYWSPKLTELRDRVFKGLKQID